MPNQVPGSSLGTTKIDAPGLAERLRRELRGEVRFDRSARALYSTDASNYRQVPIGVVTPRDTDDVLAAIALCREFGAPLLCRGGGTSLAGQCCNAAVILDFSRHMNRILELDPARRIARIEPGVVLDTLRNAAEQHHLTFGPDPASHDRCTLGGMIGNNSCGVHSIMAGKTDANIEALEVVTYDGARMQVGEGFIRAHDEPCGDSPGSSGRQTDRMNQIHSSLQQIAHEYAEVIRQKFPRIPRRVSGYNLNYLLPENNFHIARALVGSEGTCVTVLEATCRLVESPPARVLVAVAYPDIYQCADHLPEILAHKPIGLEGFDDIFVNYAHTRRINSSGVSLLPQGGGWLLVEFGGASLSDAESQALALITSLTRSASPPQTNLYSGAQARSVWAVREAALGVTSHVPGEPMNWEGWEDAAVAPEKLGDYLRDLRQLMNAFDYKGSFYGHFGHACVHTRINFDLESKEGIVKFRRFMEEAADLVVGYGGSLSGEHGDGQARAELLPKMFGPELMEAFRKFKTAWDPDWKMNPGKLIGLPGKPPNKLDENLRLGAGYAPRQPKTFFQFPEDHGRLAEATLRCVGVGKCRREVVGKDGGLMCPSYRVTREEEHSTRGRAHLLWEMMQGEGRSDAVLRNGWQSEEVKQSLDLCLSCKGCKSDCPVGVDVATYKAEFLSHYYEGRRRPRSAYAFGYIDLWTRAASNVPGLANLITQTPLVRDIAKLGAGIVPQRSLPALAPESFKSWFFRTRDSWRGGRIHPPRGRSFSVDDPESRFLPPDECVPGSISSSAANAVLLWPDTFNNYFHPQTAQAAVEVLEAAGFRVVVPRVPLCCGRPLYDFGLLDRAQTLILNILDELSPAIEAGIPIVGLEPSCVSVFRDELLNLFPHDERAQKLTRQTFLLSEFLDQRAVGPLPQFPRKALLHGHCHHKSVLKMSAEESLFRRLGVEFQSPAPGCCGMAGSFGFETDKYDVSTAIGELELLPAVRRAPPAWLIIADGFSCREQIAQGTDRRALHTAEVLQMALDADPAIADPYPESSRIRQQEAEVRRSMKRTAIGLGAAAVGGLLLWQSIRNH